jgi:hypothetical protein
MEGTDAARGEAQNYIRHLEQHIIEFEKKAAIPERGNKYLKEKLQVALYRQFGRHTEKFTGEGQ